ncbi:MAG: hypothetical protein WDN24_18225 [Sphingomonas sp.]
MKHGAFDTMAIHRLDQRVHIVDETVDVHLAVFAVITPLLRCLKSMGVHVEHLLLLDST